MSGTVEEHEAKSALTPTRGFLRGISHSLNPYSGCVFGCAYCYVQELPVALYSPLAEQGWGAWVRPKVNIAALLHAELQRRATRGSLDGLSIFMSSATDPYQPLELRYRLTRGCLEVMAERQPGWLIVQTRGPMVVRDIDLLQRLGRRVMVSMTVETDDEAVRRAVSPRTPALRRRQQAMLELRQAGIYVQAAIAPLLPCDPERLAEQLEPICDRVLVDTYAAGDGAGGRRTAKLGIPELYERLGWGDWRNNPPLEQVISSLKRKLGPERVVWSQPGFVQPPPGYGAESLLQQ